MVQGPSGVVQLAGGRVRGADLGGVWAFSGIPYAAAPVGPLRWRGPQRHAGWRGVRDAAAFGPVAPQAAPGAGPALAGRAVEQSEDCLSLNVWTPALGEGRRAPVLVWVHGGGFTSGAGSFPLYHGEALARAAGVVVVTFNYRLGALGFLGHPVLVDGSDLVANFGLADQVAALRWVREHVAAFGGDPGNVTVFGESAGGMSISALLAVPAARGLFHRAVVESGPPYTHDMGRAAEVAADLFSALGVRAPSRRVLEQVPAHELVAATAALQGRLPRPGEVPLPHLPVVDRAFLPAPPLDAVAAGSAAGVPLVVGTNRDELTLFGLGDPRRKVTNHRALRRRLWRSAPGLDVDRAVDTYRRARAGRGEPVDPGALWTAMGSDLVFRWPSLRLAAAQRAHQPATYVYLFTWESPFLGGTLGATHGMEIPFIFRSVAHPVVSALVGGGAAAEHLSEMMSGAVAAFARTGDPSHPLLGPWPAWDAADRATMVFGPSTGVVARPRDEELAVWEAVQPMPVRTGPPVTRAAAGSATMRR